jgi:hypothetical protein
MPLSLAAVAHICLQATSCDMTFETGSLPPIRPSITTLLVVLTTRVPRRGSLEAMPSMVGEPLDACCGFTENVRFFLFRPNCY